MNYNRSLLIFTGEPVPAHDEVARIFEEAAQLASVQGNHKLALEFWAVAASHAMEGAYIEDLLAECERIINYEKLQNGDLPPLRWDA